MTRFRIWNVLRKTALIVLLPLLIWCVFALHFILFNENTLLTGIAGILFCGLWLLSLFVKKAIFVPLGMALVILTGFCALTPAYRFSKVKWQTPWQRRPRAVLLGGNKIKFYDVRDFRYESESKMIVRYKDMIFDLDDLRSVDLALSHWDGLEMVAHTMLAFNFAKSPTLVLSLETRIPEGKTQSAVAGLFKQYEIIPVLGTEEDIFDLRIKYRGEDFYRYRTRTTREQARKLLQAVAFYVNGRPRFYNTLTRNCSTGLLPFLRVLRLDPIEDIRLVINGYSDQLMYRLGYLEHDEGESFASLRHRSYVPGKSRGTPAK